MWGATSQLAQDQFSPAFQFTHPVWGATQCSIIVREGTKVSIHAPRVGCDMPLPMLVVISSGFNSRTPCGVRPTDDKAHNNTSGFNSRTPCGVRPLAPLRKVVKAKFQFTHPVWGATSYATIIRRCRNVSIHAPRVGCDLDARRRLKTIRKFQFTHPVWGATSFSVAHFIRATFQFTHPVWGATLKSAYIILSDPKFQFTHPVWGAT